MRCTSSPTVSMRTGVPSTSVSRALVTHALELDLVSLEHDLDLLSPTRHEVLHAASGTSSQSVSTCAVCGNMS